MITGTVLTPLEVDTLTALVENGPLWAGDLPDDRSASSLIGRGMATRTLVKMEEGYTAVTPRGRDAYCRIFGTSLGGAADSVAEAYANRLAQAATARAARKNVK